MQEPRTASNDVESLVRVGARDRGIIGADISDIDENVGAIDVDDEIIGASDDCRDKFGVPAPRDGICDARNIAGTCDGAARNGVGCRGASRQEYRAVCEIEGAIDGARVAIGVIDD